MIQAILLILKIIGITLLVILGLLLLILALVLFVPVFYRVRVIHNPEKTEVRARVSFLFPLLLVTVQYLKKLFYKVRIFGFPLLDSERPKKEKKPKNKKKTGKGKKPKDLKTDREESEEDGSESPEAGQDTGATEPGQNTESPGTVSGQPEQVNQAAGSEESGEPEQPNQATGQANTEEQPQEAQKPGFFEKIRLKIQKIRETIINILTKIKKLLHQKDEVLRILNEPSGKRAIAYTWDKVKRLVKHILPRKIKGYVKFGADNPATTGQVTGIVSVLYAKTGYLLDFQPNFQEAELECDVEFRGHIQVFTLLLLALKVVLNKEFRKLLKELKHVKDVE